MYQSGTIDIIMIDVSPIFEGRPYNYAEYIIQGFRREHTKI